MKPEQLLNFLLATIIICSCNKATDPSDQTTQIDVSKQWTINSVRHLILGLGDGQWQAKVFTSREQNLFNSLDTANLTGTTKPDSVFESPIEYNCSFPNPFTAFNQMSFRFTNAFNGQMIFKFVIVDSLMHSLYKDAIRIQATSNPLIPLNPSSGNLITIYPNVPIGRYRFYYTLSSQLNQHFYKCWGNIQKN